VISKQAAEYMYAAGSTRTCGTCSMFRDNGEQGACQLVRGVIRRSDTCKYWERKRDMTPKGEKR
jgi:hypothetical protein